MLKCFSRRCASGYMDGNVYGLNLNKEEEEEEEACIISFYKFSYKMDNNGHGDFLDMAQVREDYMGMLNIYLY